MDPISYLIQQLDCVPVGAEEKKMATETPRPVAKKTLSEVKRALYPRHADAERQFQKGGSDLTYIPWHHAVRILDKATNGFWDYEITRLDIVREKTAVVAVKLRLLCSDGEFSYDGQGYEELAVKGFGDAYSNAESMAFRRACAKAGLGLYLYHK